VPTRGSTPGCGKLSRQSDFQELLLSLSTAERSRFLERLIAGLDVDPEIEEAWVGSGLLCLLARENR
jgi:hypothetical protein